MSRYFKATIKENLPLNSKHNLLTLVTPGGVADPLPGQFYMIEVNKGYDPFLKRAFSLFRKKPDGFQILYRIIGKGTSLLSRIKEGEDIVVLGPLGRPFKVPAARHIPLVIAGGIGIASVFSFVERISGNAYMFYGALSKNDLLMIDELQMHSKKLILSTDDGSAGVKGTVIEAVSNYLKHEASRITEHVIYACGPKPMLKEIARLAVANNIKAYVSLEENMACGIGACQGCTVEARNRKSRTGNQKSETISKSLTDVSSKITYKKVCTDGPVFNIEDIVW